MGYQDWAPYSGLEEAAEVYLRDPEIALDQLRGFVDFATIRAFIMARGVNNEPWGEAIWQEVALTDGSRLLMWHGTDEMATRADREQRRMLDASVRTIALSSITDQSLSTEFEILDDGTRRLSQVRLRMYTQLFNRSRRTSATETDLICECFRFTKSVDNGGLAQMQRLIQFARVLSRTTAAVE